MEFYISSDSLQKAVKMAGVVVKANEEDYSSKLFIDCSENVVNIFVNNGRMSLNTTQTNVNVVTPGKVALSYGEIKSFIMSFKCWDGSAGVKEFLFSSDGRITTISVENIVADRTIKGDLKVSNSDNVGFFRKEFTKANFSFNSTIFRLATNKVAYAIDGLLDTSLEALKGMLISFDESNIYFTGSNGKLLSEYVVKNVVGRVENDIVIPHEFLMALRRLIVDDMQLLFEIDHNNIIIKFDNMELGGCLIVGHKYPSYRDNFDNYQYHLNLSREFLCSALPPTVDVLDSEDNFRLTLRIKDKLFRLSNDHINIESELDIEGGIDFSVDVNGRLLLQTIEAIHDDYILFKFKGGLTPLIFDSSTYNDQKSLLTPMRSR